MRCMKGPNPKPPSKRRRANIPASYGLAAPITAPAAPGTVRTLDFDGPVHKLVDSMWTALQTSCESRFFSAADWERARLELWFANEAMNSDKPIPGNVWAVVQNGLSALLISPADKRRCGIELKPSNVDADEDAAILTMVKYQAKLQPE